MNENAGRMTSTIDSDPLLTYGNWAAGKEALTTLALLPATEGLARELTRLYGRIFSASHGHGQPPTAAELEAAVSELEAVHSELAAELDESWLLGILRDRTDRRE